MTTALCAQLAVAAGYEYLALQEGSACYMGRPYAYDKDYASWFSTGGTCDSPCAGMPSETCGGSCSSALWKVPRVPGDRLQCFTPASFEVLLLLMRKISSKPRSTACVSSSSPAPQSWNSGAVAANLRLTIHGADSFTKIMDSRVYKYSSGAECVDKCKGTAGCKMATWSTATTSCQLMPIVNYTAMYTSSGTYVYVPGKVPWHSAFVASKRGIPTLDQLRTCMCRRRRCIQGPRSQVGGSIAAGCANGGQPPEKCHAG
jgi:hypothetical protein